MTAIDRRKFLLRASAAAVAAALPAAKPFYSGELVIEWGIDWGLESYNGFGYSVEAMRKFHLMRYAFIADGTRITVGDCVTGAGLPDGSVISTILRSS